MQSNELMSCFADTNNLKKYNSSIFVNRFEILPDKKKAKPLKQTLKTHTTIYNRPSQKLTGLIYFYINIFLYSSVLNCKGGVNKTGGRSGKLFRFYKRLEVLLVTLLCYLNSLVV